MQLWEVKLLVRHALKAEPTLFVALGLFVAFAFVLGKWLALRRRHMALKRSYEGLLKEMEDTGVRRELVLLPEVHPLNAAAQPRIEPS